MAIPGPSRSGVIEFARRTEIIQQAPKAEMEGALREGAKIFSNQAVMIAVGVDAVRFQPTRNY